MGVRKTVLPIIISTLIFATLGLSTEAFAQTSSDPPPNFKVAFIGDQGSNSNSEAVLQLIADENADMVLHQGDFDYSDNPTDWDNRINTYLGSEFPYFASVGNHDVPQWTGYQTKLLERLAKITGADCTGEYGVQSSCHYRGLFFILSGVGTMGSGHESYIQSELAADDSVWSICSWHKNQNAMQVGGKGNSVGWGAYEECRLGGAMVATAHEHSYERTKTLSNIQTQVVDSAWSNPNEVRVAEGSTFVFVSGLGGQSIRDQERCTPTSYPYGCSGEWASIYTLDQGANHGALFCSFNVGGVDKASCYFKNISGQVIDSFNVTSFMGANGTNPSPILDIRISGSNNDAEETLATGSMDLTSSDIELGTDPGNNGVQASGLRFTNVGIPHGATITAAYLEFETDELDSEVTDVVIRSQLADNTVAFSSTNFDITSRPTSIASVPWSIPEWNITSEKHNSPDISTLVQEVVNRPGWTENNSMTFIISGTGQRTAESYDGEPAAAVLLHVEYDNTQDTTPPVITLTGNNPQTIELGLGYIELGATTDDGSPVTIDSTEFVDAVGAYSIYYDSTDGTNAATTVTRTVNVVDNSNAPPDAFSQSVSTTGGSILITLSGYDADGDSLTFSIVSQPPDGRLKKMTTISPTEAEITYNPKRSFTGTDSFEFLVNDGADNSNVANVTITEEVPPNTPPVANNDSTSTEQNTLVTIDVLANDSDEDNDTLTIFSINVAGTQGSVVINNNKIEYTAGDSTGIDTFTYIASDGTDQSNLATVTIDVTLPSTNNPPVANAGSEQNVVEHIVVTLDGTGSSDPDDDSLTYQWIKISGPKVTLSDSTSAKPTFIAPNVGPKGKTIEFQLTVSDGKLIVSDTVRINIANS